VALNIDKLDLIYLDEDGNITATLTDIRSVQITIVARTDRSDPAYNNALQYYNLQGTSIYGPANDGYHRNAMSVQVKCRNLGL
jgi:type IV pilus assembly protein PilW